MPQPRSRLRSRAFLSVPARLRTPRPLQNWRVGRHLGPFAPLLRGAGSLVQTCGGQHHPTTNANAHERKLPTTAPNSDSDTVATSRSGYPARTVTNIANAPSRCVTPVLAALPQRPLVPTLPNTQTPSGLSPEPTNQPVVPLVVVAATGRSPLAASDRKLRAVLLVLSAKLVAPEATWRAGVVEWQAATVAKRDRRARNATRRVDG